MMEILKKIKNYVRFDEEFVAKALENIEEMEYKHIKKALLDSGMNPKKAQQLAHILNFEYSSKKWLPGFGAAIDVLEAQKNYVLEQKSEVINKDVRTSEEGISDNLSSSPPKIGVAIDGRNIFENILASPSIFRNKEAFMHSYTPEQLPHREKEIERLAAVLKPALKGETPPNILIYGKKGTGKTTVVNFVGKQLESMSRRMNVICRVHYLNCEGIDTQYRVLATFAKILGKTGLMNKDSIDQVYEEIRESIDRMNQSIILVLDEIDKLIKKGDEVLYNLSKINSDLKNARVSIIGISNDLIFKNFLDPRVIDSLSEEELIFPPYNAEQLQDILQQRADIALTPNVLKSRVIALCAAIAAHEYGDARKALDLLRVSGEIVEGENSEFITTEHVMKASEKIEIDRVLEEVKMLSTQNKVLLLSMIQLYEAGFEKFTIEQIYPVYKSLCNKVDIDVLSQRRISDLVSELDMLGIINSIIISKGTKSRTREIKLYISIEPVKETLIEDYRLENIIDYTNKKFDSSIKESIEKRVNENKKQKDDE